ncbi:MAG: hypothetical protein AB7L84_10860 [Acidimicrobiia bacterium]
MPATKLARTAGRMLACAAVVGSTIGVGVSAPADAAPEVSVACTASPSNDFTKQWWNAPQLQEFHNLNIRAKVDVTAPATVAPGQNVNMTHRWQIGLTQAQAQKLAAADVVDIAAYGGLFPVSVGGPASGSISKEITNTEYKKPNNGQALMFDVGTFPDTFKVNANAADGAEVTLTAGAFKVYDLRLYRPQQPAIAMHLSCAAPGLVHTATVDAPEPEPEPEPEPGPIDPGNPPPLNGCTEGPDGCEPPGLPDGPGDIIGCPVNTICGPVPTLPPMPRPTGPDGDPDGGDPADGDPSGGDPSGSDPDGGDPADGGSGAGGTDPSGTGTSVLGTGTARAAVPVSGTKPRYNG